MSQLRGSGVTLEKIMTAADPTQQSKINIVCTMGPSCWDTDTLVHLIDEGLTVARLNFSHGDHESHAATVKSLAAAKHQRPEKHVALMLDTKGPEIRTGFLEPDFKPLNLVRGQSLEIVTDYEVLGNNTRLACSYKGLPTSVEVGARILAADGSLVMTVTELREESVMVRVENNCKIGERKNMNLPGVKVDLPVLTEKDIHDLVDFGLEYPVDMIALSFTQSAADVERCREVLGERGAHIKIISKIENQEGLVNYDEILAATDGVMVARGDLGMEIPPEKVFLAQKMMIRKCNIAGKPVITATQMLESMCGNPRPTRAECTDVANAVLDGTDAVMLSGETAGGSYPREAVAMMAHICREAQSVIDYSALYLAVRGSTLSKCRTMETAEAICSSAVKTALDLGAKMIVVLTESGNTARLVAKYRPPQPLLVLTGSQHVARQSFGLLRGTECRVVGSMMGTAGILIRAAKIGREQGFIKPGETMVAIHGAMEGQSGYTNQLKVLVCPDN